MFRPSMEDDFKIIDSQLEDPNTGLFNVFDGHGGKTAVNFLVNRLHEQLGNELMQTPDKIQEAFTRAFRKTDKQMKLEDT